MKPILVTGIKPTGKIHLGNYVGVIRPSLKYISQYDCRFFVADYHALNSGIKPNVLKTYTQEIATIWLSCGLLHQNCLLFKQSDVPEIMEMSILLANFASKNRLNGSHAYKAAVAQNLEYQRSEDHGINAGLFLYPVLMAADILAQNAAFVPVGKDQVQHLEIVKDIAQAVNLHCEQEIFSLPLEIGQEGIHPIILGTNGKKMSKSNKNTIDLIGNESSLKKQIHSIITTPQSINEKKDPHHCNIFSIFSLFATEQEITSLQNRYLQGGLGWGSAKQSLYEVLLRELSPIWENYHKLQQDPSLVNQLLEKNGKIAREHVVKNLQIIKKSVGLS